MPVFARLYREGRAAIAHAVATPYRERSHIGGQEGLQSGQPRPGLVASGWLNRALLALPQGDRVTARAGLAIGSGVPLILRGPAPVLGWAPQDLSRPGAAGSGLEHAAAMRQANHEAARLMAADDGPRVAALSFNGWDTHAAEGAAGGRLAQLLRGLDGAFGEFEAGLGDFWKQTAIAAVTEFGRSARFNT